MADSYLYNGYKLPKLPERDETIYPYACIGTNLMTWAAFYSSVPFTCDVDGGYVVSSEANLLFVGNNTLTDGSWQEPSPDVPSAQYYIKWANHDVLNEDGTLYLAATDPIPVNPTDPIPVNPIDPIPVNPIDPTSMLQGWIVGRRIAGQREKREPVAYLYNGVRLPQLPDWDRETYPYALISRHFVHRELYYFRCTTHPSALITYDSGSTRVRPLWTNIGNTPKYYTVVARMTVGSDEWTIINSDMTEVVALTDFRDVIWSNADIKHNNWYDLLLGETYLAASEPVPVYE